VLEIRRVAIILGSPPVKKGAARDGVLSNAGLAEDWRFAKVSMRWQMSTKKKTGSFLSRQAANAFSPFGMPGRIQASPNTEEKTFSLFQPDILLPAQYFATTKRKDHLEPEKKLMLAVLEDAVWCFQHYLLAQEQREKSLFRDAEEWIMEEHADWLFSFQNVCEALDLNPKYVRKGLMRWRERELSATRPKAKLYRLTPDPRSRKRVVDPARSGRRSLLKAAAG